MCDEVVNVLVKVIIKDNTILVLYILQVFGGFPYIFFFFCLNLWYKVKYLKWILTGFLFLKQYQFINYLHILWLVIVVLVVGPSKCNSIIFSFYSKCVGEAEWGIKFLLQSNPLTAHRDRWQDLNETWCWHWNQPCIVLTGW